MQFNQIFKDEYQFTLKRVMYQMIDKDLDNNIKLNIKDSITTNTEHKQLEIDFKRRVCFEPEALYELEVVFSSTLSYLNDGKYNEFKNTDWNKELLEANPPYLSNMVSRASNLISTITTSYGQTPLITPPNFIQE